MTERLQAVFDRAAGEDRGVLNAYLPAGYPDLTTSEALFSAAIEGGADVIEFGIPWSDPAADGPVIEAASSAALHAGLTVGHALALGARLRKRFPDTPLVAMTYANLAYQRGWDGFAAALREHGFDGAILADVPLEESDPARAALAAAGLAWVPLVAPTTPPERMAAIAATATGFLYVVGNVGTTGQADPGALVEATVARAREAGAEVPLCVGFGIATTDDVARVLAAGADGAIVGTALVRKAEQGPEAVRDAVARLRAQVHRV